MFNLGTKNSCNSNANVTEANGVISIAGFGTFAIPTVAAAGRQGEFLLQNAVWQCVHNHSLHLMTILRHLRKSMSNIFSDIDVWTF
jgi:hypothetical protein